MKMNRAHAPASFAAACPTGSAQSAHQCSLIDGTVFESSKLGLSRWFLAMQPLTQSKNNVAAPELMRKLGVSCRTAWT